MDLNRNKYKGWDVKNLRNQWVNLSIAPQLGGRIVQFEMDGYEFFFSNSLLSGKEPDATRLGENGTWLNYGGEKVWPAPQGWDSPEKWPGPPDPTLDGGIYSVEGEKTAEIGSELKLNSPVDYRTGLQITKRIFVASERSLAKVDISFRNIGKTPIKWSVWPVIQMNALEYTDSRYRIICPLNKKSGFYNGYHVMHGLANNPQNQKDDSGNLLVKYQYLVGKVGVDSNAGWIAFLDSVTGKIFILIFEHKENKSYPENTSVQIWTQGEGIIFSRNEIVKYDNDPLLNPPYMEMEILSPLYEISPGKKIDFGYRMLSSTIPSNNKTIKSVNEFGVIVSSLKLEVKDDDISIDAKYGVFIEGKIVIAASGTSRIEINHKNILCESEVTPLKGTHLSLITGKELLDGMNFLLVLVFDNNNNYLGEIERIRLK